MFITRTIFLKTIHVFMTLALAISLLFTTVVHAEGGDLDPGFFSLEVAAGESGDTPKSLVALLSDERIILAGRVCNAGCDIVLARFNADGSPDDTFSADGIQTTDLGAQEHIYGLAIQADDKIIVSGNTCGDGICHLFIARYTPDGELDPSFNGNGVFILKTKDRQSYTWGGLAIRPNGMIAVSAILETKKYKYPAIVVQLKSNGRLHRAFGQKGIAYLNLPDFTGSDLVIQSNGKIVITGSVQTPSHINDTVLIRLTADGTKLDKTFGKKGKQITDFGGDDGATSVTLGTDEKIVLTAWSLNNGYETWYAARYNSNGSLDTAFNGSGIVTTDITHDADDSAYDALVQPDGKIVVVGYTNIYGYARDIVVIRYNVDGSQDTSFGMDGILTLDYYSQDYGHSIVRQSDDKYIVASSSLHITGSGDPRYLKLTRLLP